jgi:hypothetical protein
MIASRPYLAFREGELEMAIHVANPEACALLKLFAKERGASMSQAVKIAVKEALAARDQPMDKAEADNAATDIAPRG